MTERGRLLQLIDAGRRDEAIALLRESFTIPAATGERSTEAALAAAVKLFGGDIEQTARWMSSRSPYLGTSPHDRAEQSADGLDQVLHMIAQLEAGVFI